MEDGFDIITGADGFIGKELSEELSKSNPILLSRTKKYYKNASYVQYDMETGLNSLINSDIKINNVIHLAHDFSNKYLDNFLSVKVNYHYFLPLVIFGRF